MATVVLNIAIQSQKQPSQAQTLVFVQDLISLDKTAFIESKALILVELMRQGPVICACKSARTQFKPQKKVSAADTSNVPTPLPRALSLTTKDVMRPILPS
jgi:hypothetical protein